MRLIRALCARTKFWDRYVSRVRDRPSTKTRFDVFRGNQEFKQEEFYYDENRPWTDAFHNQNLPYEKVKEVLVEPMEEWSIYKGDRVEVMVGKDKGKQGLVNSIIKERNWVFVEGLNCEYETKAEVQNLAPTCNKKEMPLLVTTQVKLVDPTDEQGTDFDWRYTEEGDRVRVSVRTGRIIPLPSGGMEVDRYVIPGAYIENEVKDSKEKDVLEITFTPKLCTFEDDINKDFGIVDDRKPVKSYWY